MPKVTRVLVLAATVLCLGLLTNASASSFSGAYDYAYLEDSVNSGCTSGATNDFASTSGGNSISATDPVVFSICSNVPGALAGGEFTIGSGADTAAGTFSGEFVGFSLDDGEIFDGTFQLISAAGIYTDVQNAEGVFEVVTGSVDVGPADADVDAGELAAAPGGYLTGTFDFSSTPEPATMALGGSGLLLLLSRKRRSRRA